LSKGKNAILMNSHCLTILDELGYIPVPSKAEYIVSDSIKKSFESLFGQEATISILNHLTSLYGLSEKELTTNYDIFEKSLYIISNYAAKILLRYIKKEILIETVSQFPTAITEQDILDPGTRIEDIVKKISNEEIIKFVHRIQAGEHLIFIYEMEDSKDKVLSAFFDDSYSIANGQIMSRGLISSEKTRFDYIANILYYDDLLAAIEQPEQITIICERIKNWFVGIGKNSSIPKEGHSKQTGERQGQGQHKDKDMIFVSSTIRAAVEDAPQLFVNHFTYELLSIEKTIKECLSNNSDISVLCAFKASNISNNNDDNNNDHILRSIIESHEYVIFEDPLIIYKPIRR
jgi:hypothetical protein